MIRAEGWVPRLVVDVGGETVDTRLVEAGLAPGVIVQVGTPGPAPLGPVPTLRAGAALLIEALTILPSVHLAATVPGRGPPRAAGVGAGTKRTSRAHQSFQGW